jgi:hypothetical protein
MLRAAPLAAMALLAVVPVLLTFAPAPSTCGALTGRTAHNPKGARGVQQAADVSFAWMHGCHVFVDSVQLLHGLSTQRHPCCAGQDPTPGAYAAMPALTPAATPTGKVMYL